MKTLKTFDDIDRLAHQLQHDHDQHKSGTIVGFLYITIFIVFGFIVGLLIK